MILRNIIKRGNLYSVFDQLRYNSHYNIEQGLGLGLHQKPWKTMNQSRNLAYAYNDDGSVSDTSNRPKRRRKKVPKKPIESDLDDVKIK